MVQDRLSHHDHEHETDSSESTSNLGDQIRNFLEQLLDDYPMLASLLSIFGIETDEDLTDEQRDRLEVAAEVTSQHGNIYFDDSTNPLPEDPGQPSATNPLIVPGPDVDIPSHNPNLRDTWARKGGRLVWCTEDYRGNPLYFHEEDIMFIVRSGYNPAIHDSIESFLDGIMKNVTFFGASFRVHPVFAARLRLARANLLAAGITEQNYQIGRASGWKFRAMNDAGRASNHSLGLAEDFDPGDGPGENAMAQFESIEAAMASTNYPGGMSEAMSDAGIRTPEQWTGANNQIDTMHWDLNLDPGGIVPWEFTAEHHAHS